MGTYIIRAARERASKALFNWRCAGVRDLPPVKLNHGPVTVLSQVSGHDVTMYLVAVRSFCRYLTGGRVVVVDDGTLGVEGRKTIERSVSGVEFVDLDTIGTGECPRGACWERLCEVLDRCRDGYVIQLDSDMICLREPVEALEAVKQNRPFLLGTSNGTRIHSLAEASALARGIESNHVQPAVERQLETLEEAATRRYVRACAAFAGFARGAARRQDAERFSAAMTEKLGKRWQEWGTEQVTSNYLLANAEGSLVLPYPEYTSAEPGLKLDGCKMIHFLGAWRWSGGHYRRLAAGLLEEWRQG
ncbi:MAG: hypothetical protein C0504_16715 [Candidatus Solibacter sp.]|nr:hypothetical protein [Candidatus Solibacter sp.]